MKNRILISLISLSSAFTMHAQNCTTANPQLDVQGPLYTRGNFLTLNKTGNGWITWAQKNNSTLEATIDFYNINNASFIGNIGIGTSALDGKLVIAEGGQALTIGSGSIGFNRNYVDGKIYNNNVSAWQINGGNDGFAIQGFNSGTFNQPFKILKNGNIGIGTPTPEGKVVIAENGSALSIGSGSIGFNRNYVDGKIYNTNMSAWQINGGDDGFSIQGFNSGTFNQPFKILKNGDIGIGTPTPKYKLDVLGTIRAREIQVDLNGADFVFEEDYKLMPLNELEDFVKEKKHLPEIMPAKEMEKNGTELGDLNSKLLQKIEELTLYTIELNKRVEQQDAKIKILEKEIK